MIKNTRESGDHAVCVISGQSGSGRTNRMIQAVSGLVSEGHHSAAAFVSPEGDIALHEGAGGFPVLTGSLVRSQDIFFQLLVMMQSCPGGLVVGIDDAEMLPDSRKLWISLVSMACQTGSRLFVVVPDLGSGRNWGSAVRMLADGILSFPSMPFDTRLVSLKGAWAAP